MPWSWVRGCSSLATIVLSSGCLLLAEPPPFSDEEVPMPADGWVDVVSVATACALHTDGSLWCGSPGRLGLMDEGPLVAVSRGDDGSLCAVHGDEERLSCMSTSLDVGGTNLSGPYVDVAGGERVGCGLLAGGEARCWPEDAAAPGPFATIAVGGGAACGIREGSGALSCWSIDDVILDEVLTDVPSGAFTQVALFDTIGCALTTGGIVQCWGYDFHDLVSGPPTGSYVHLALGRDAGCAVSSTGSVACWGEDSALLEGQIPSLDDATFERLDLGLYSGDVACGIDSLSRLHCW